MGKPVFKTVSMMMILSFLVSVLPHTMYSMNEEQVLSSVIRQIQQLQKSPEKSSIDFRIVFSNVITTLNFAAGLNKTFSPKNKTSDSKKPQFIVSVRLPYLMPLGFVLHAARFEKTLTLNSRFVFLYQSHTTSPEVPPPITVLG